jgi:predicted GNAT family N-acyltransferase
MTELEIVEIADDGDRARAFAIRREVFCAEQGVPAAEEFGGRDGESRQYLARLAGRPVGTARLRESAPGEAKIERVAVLKAMRRHGVGRALMDRTIADARAAGMARILIHAQCHAEAFYAAVGFRTIGGRFEEAGIPHVKMVLADPFR